MKDYQYKIVLVFFIIGLIIILGMGIAFNIMPADSANAIILVTSIALIIYAIGGVVVAIITQKKIIDPMSRMLKSGTIITEEDIENIDFDNSSSIANLREELRQLNEQKIQTDTILEHMTDGVISFDLDGNVKYINHMAQQMLDLKDSDTTFNKIFSERKKAFHHLYHQTLCSQAKVNTTAHRQFLYKTMFLQFPPHLLRLFYQRQTVFGLRVNAADYFVCNGEFEYSALPYRQSLCKNDYQSKNDTLSHRQP